MLNLTPAQKRMVIFVVPLILNEEGNGFASPYEDGRELARLLKRTLQDPTFGCQILAFSMILATRPWGEDLRPHLQRLPQAAEWWNGVNGMAGYLRMLGEVLAQPLDEYVFQTEAARLLGAAMKSTGQHNWISCAGVQDILYALDVYIKL